MTDPRLDEDGSWCRALARLSGEVVELGCHDGRNFELYSPAVTGVHAFEPDPSPRHRARAAAAWAATPVWVRDDPVEALPLDTASIDGAVLHLLLSRRPEPTAVVAELARVVRVGGTLVFAEPAGPGNGDPLAIVRCGGFTVDTWRAQDPAGLRVLGSATRATR
ncbi:MAG: Methyltransferase type 11 [Actinomycetospora sp.]|jgi:SAM-dependent methyltransferase|nr:Methyltransferase type 11 [Actinomycetospora sp.]